MSSPFDLAGRTALVTGVNRGIGAAVAMALARAGADIVGVSRMLGSDEAVAAAVRGTGRDYAPLHADLRDRAAIAGLLAQVGALPRPVNILVNNAGVIRRAPAERHDDAAWDEVIAVDLSAQFALARGIGAGMLKRRCGKVVFVASMQSYRGGIDIIGYAAAKAGVLGLVRGLACEWAARGVNVNAIAPGYIETDMTRMRHSDEALKREVTERIPAGRWGRADDVGGAAVFLASSASDYVHGAVVPVDGGWLAR